LKERKFRPASRFSVVRNRNRVNAMTAPLLTDLMTRFLAAPHGSDVPSGDVVPHEVLTAFRVDARTAWVETKAAVTLLGGEKMDMAAPPEWAAVVSWAEIVAVPIAIGNYPQMAREVGRLISFDLASPPSANEADFSSLKRWAAKEAKANSPAARLTAAATYRLLGRFEDANAVLESAKSTCTGPWAIVHTNESATLLFAQSDYAIAAQMWNAMPDSPVTAFNRGLAFLALGQRIEAGDQFRTAAGGLPSNASWADLARLYLAVAEMSV
jgi:hypothetical protein